MLKLKPNCECCNVDLPPAAANALICTYECTFCTDCADQHFSRVCPNCSGELVKRPIRPPKMLVKHPASTERVVKSHAACHAQASTS